MSEKTKREKVFSHEIGELVLVKWDDGMVYFAKIKRIDWRRRQCIVIFDDKSSDKATFSQIHSVDETTTDIICIKCKRDNSKFPNEIVLCDGCGIGFHQKCHSPAIPASALELDNPWKCIYCQKSTKNPYLTESIDAMQSLFEEDTDESSQPQDEIDQQVKQAGIVIKQEVVSDDDSSTTFYQKPLAQPLQTTRKRKGRHSNYESKKLQAKRRPLHVLRRKFARSRLGRASNTHKKVHELQKNVDPSREDELEEMSTEEFLQTSSSSVRSPALRKRKASEIEYQKSDNSESESSIEDEVVGQMNDNQTRSKKRPRSLRVSLTLPPSVETTPIGNNRFSVTPKVPAVNHLATVEQMVDTPTIQPVQSDTSCNQPDPTTVSSIVPPQEKEKDETIVNEEVSSLEQCSPKAESPKVESPKVESPKVVSPKVGSPKESLEAGSPQVGSPKTGEVGSPKTGEVGSPKTEEVESPKASSKVSKEDATSHSGNVLSPPSTITVTSVMSNSQSAPVSTVAAALCSRPSTLFTTTSENSLVKVSAGVTKLKPIKRKRVQDSGSPVNSLSVKNTAALSPLERLRYEIAASKRSEMLKSQKLVPVSTSSSPMVLMQSTGTITSAPPIQSAATQTHHHSRKSSAPSRAVAMSIDTVSSPPRLKQNKPQRSDLIVISPSPSPPPPPPPPTSAAAHPQLLAQHAVSSLRRPNSQVQVSSRRDDRIYPTTTETPPDPRSKVVNLGNFPQSLEQIQTNKGYILHSHQQAKNIQVQTEPLHHIHKDTVRQPTYQMYSKYHQKMPSAPNDDGSSQHHSQNVHYSHMAQYGGNGHYSATPLRPRSSSMQHSNVVAHRQPQQHSIPPPQYHNGVTSPMPQNEMHANSVEGAAFYTVVSPSHDARGPVMSVPSQVAPHTDPTLSVIRPPTQMIEGSGNVSQRTFVYNVSSGTPSCYSPQDTPVVVTTGYVSALHQPQICTTKPYAVVSAIPTHSSHKSMSPPLLSPPASLKIPPDATASVSEKQFRRPSSDTVAQRRMQDIAMIREEATSDLTQRLQSFSNKYKDFDTLSANDLMGIFHSALKKFQKNSKMYDSYTIKPNTVEKIAPPNVQVCPHHTGHSEIQVQARRNSESTPTVVVISQPSSLPKSGTMMSHEQMSSVHNRPNNRTYQVHTSGVFIPPASDHSTEFAVYKQHQQQQPRMSPHSTSQQLQQCRSIQQQAPVQKSDAMCEASGITSKNAVGSTVSPATGSVIVSTSQKVPTEKRRRKPEAPANINHIRSMFAQNISEKNISSSTSNQQPSKGTDPKRVCAKCGKHATFLCSGCHKIWYCGRDCQIKSWDQHANTCRP